MICLKTIIRLILIEHTLACIRTIPSQSVSIPYKAIRNVEKLPRSIFKAPVVEEIVKQSPKPVRIVAKKIEEESINTTKIIPELFVKNEVVQKVAQPLLGCHEEQIKFTPPDSGAQPEKFIVAPELECMTKSITGCSLLKATCTLANHTDFRFVSGFAKIDNVDWATTDLHRSDAVFQLECDAFNRWVYISDIPGIEGKVFPTNEVFCLLVPDLTEGDASREDDDYE